MKLVIAIDPGDVHVGWAEWRGTLDRTDAARWRAYEVGADEAVDLVDRELAVAQSSKLPSVLVLEKFQLYEDKAMDQVGSEMLTAQMIGALKHVAGRRDAEVREQGAGIQKPTEAQLQARGIELMRAGPHAKSAQLHLVHYLLKEGIWTT